MESNHANLCFLIATSPYSPLSVDGRPSLKPKVGKRLDVDEASTVVTIPNNGSDEANTSTPIDPR